MNIWDIFTDKPVLKLVCLLITATSKHYMVLFR